MSKEIFWLASYPKSGNTLLRSILVGLFFTNDGVFSLDKSKLITQFDTTNLIKKNQNIFSKKDYNNLSNINLFYKYINKLQTKESLGFKEDFIFLKTHSGLFNVGGNAFTKEENCRGIIYILRDPRDVCVSYSKHSKVSIDECINFMTTDIASIYWMESRKKGNIFPDNLRPKSLISSWEKHVMSWTVTKWKIPILILKYEDLVYNKEDTVSKIISFFEKNYNFQFGNKDNKIKNIIKSTDFKKLKEEEKKHGFAEAIDNVDFFSVGKKEQWKKQLNNDQKKILENRFSQLMKRYNYKI